MLVVTGKRKSIFMDAMLVQLKIKEHERSEAKCFPTCV